MPEASKIYSAEKIKKRFDDFIMLVRDQGSIYFILLLGHILYRKSGGHKIVCTGIKFISCFNVVKNHTKRFLVFRKRVGLYKCSLTYLRRTVS